jgi:hypothetical protein
MLSESSSFVCGSVSPSPSPSPSLTLESQQQVLWSRQSPYSIGTKIFDFKSNVNLLQFIRCLSHIPTNHFLVSADYDGRFVMEFYDTEAESPCERAFYRVRGEPHQNFSFPTTCFTLLTTVRSSRRGQYLRNCGSTLFLSVDGQAIVTSSGKVVMISMTSSSSALPAKRSTFPVTQYFSKLHPTMVFHYPSHHRLNLDRVNLKIHKDEMSCEQKRTMLALRGSGSITVMFNWLPNFTGPKMSAMWKTRHEQFLCSNSDVEIGITAGCSWMTPSWQYMIVRGIFNGCVSEIAVPLM